MNKKYIENVVNFLNNTQGEIYDYQIRFMLLQMFDIDINEVELSLKLDSGTWLSLNGDIAWDDSENFINDMIKFKNKIENEVK